jgi:anaerobic magnesium-protoporphyrin IX monomethyl ester cyclase
MRVILLEHPREPSPVHFNDIANTPLWSCLMTGYAGAALLQAGFEVDLVDATPWTFSNTLQYLLDHPGDLLAIHGVYFWEKTEKLFQMLSDLRRRRYRPPICLYGFFPTLMWRDILDQVPAVDSVIVGEPEETVVCLARSLEAGTGTPVEGLALRAQGQATLAGSRPGIEPLDRLPFPLRPSLATEETICILASRGCYNRCSFCLIPTLDGGRSAWRGRTPENVAAEISQLMAKGKKDFYFVDPNFIGPGKAGKERAVQLGNTLKGLGITFGMETRANDITPAIMRSLVDAGLTSLLIGLESGSPQILRRLSKHTNITQNEQAIALIREAGLEPEIGFIMFDAGSTLDDLAQNLNFLKENGLLVQLGRTANLLYHDHIAFKGTAGYEESLAQGRLAPQGLFGFEGRLLYEDDRVGWLAGLMKSLCQFLLREMGDPLSPIYWRLEEMGIEPHQTVNDHLVEIFTRLLRMAETLTYRPEAAWTEKLLEKTVDELQGTISRGQKQELKEYGDAKRPC